MDNSVNAPDAGKSADQIGQAEIEGRTETVEKARPDMPPAGPHASPSLTNAEATPGSGALPVAPPDGEADPGVG